MEENVTMVFHGFLNLTNLEKLKMTEMINEYFDSNERELIRAANEAKFQALISNSNLRECQCCGLSPK